MIGADMAAVAANASPLAIDERFMAAALALGRRGLGQCAPNPAVGALITRDGVVIARGWTQPGGRPHAEGVALQAAGEAARGATLYVTLEPCAHRSAVTFGPSCTDAIVAAGIARVVIGARDPGPLADGAGARRLREYGIAVVAGVLEEEARCAHRAHVLRVTQGRPLVTLKLARTADGYAAGGPYDPRLAITGSAANALTHVCRAQHDAIMVGAGTILADDPLLTVRAPGLEARRPLRVVLSAAGVLAPSSRLAATARDRPTLVIAAADAPADADARLASFGIEIVRVPRAGLQLDLRAALAALSTRGITRVFSEGGPSVAAALIAEGLADDVLLMTADRPLGRIGVPAFRGSAEQTLKDTRRYRLARSYRLDDDQIESFHKVDA